MTAVLERVLLTYPTSLVVDAPEPGKPTSSWIQIAKTGEFVSNRYGTFSITKDDLAQMLFNFEYVTPKAPTQLPVDYDHLSMDPKKPGDGVAAGWMAKLELRKQGHELWAQVDWTPTGAERIAKKEYRFVSPSFVKDHTHKDGKKIGTTLLAAAITNHPFLEGMEAVTLNSGFADIASLINLMEPGQRVMVKPEAATAAVVMPVAPPPTPGTVGMEIVEVVGEGDDAFCALKAADGTVHKWFRATDLIPATVPAEQTAATPPADPTQTQAEAPKEPTPEEKAAAEAAAAEKKKKDDEEAAAKPKPVEKTNMSQTYKLRDTKGNEVEIPADEVAKAVPEGSVVMKLADVEDLRGKVTNLSTQVQTLADAAATAQTESHKTKLESELKLLSDGGFITKVERDWAAKTFGTHTDLTAFTEWKGTKKIKIVELNTERGSGADVPTEETTAQAQASGKLLDLATQIAKDERISLSAALVKASRQDPNAAREYRLGFMPDGVRKEDLVEEMRG